MIQGQVQVVGPSGLSLRDETGQILRQRLQAMALVFAILLVFTLILNLVRGHETPLLALRAGILALVLAGLGLLSSRRALSMPMLRVLELVLFSLIGVQVLVMSSVHLLKYAAEGDAVSATAAADGLFITWTLLLIGYGMVIPNTWRRAAAVLVPAAFLPNILVLILSWHSESIDTVLRASRFPVNFHLAPLFAACGSVYLSHFVDRIRQEAFQAKRLGQYQLKEEIATGGMGQVFRAEHALLKRPCAIKLIRPEFEKDARALARFEREVQSMARLTHWNTVQIFDYGHTNEGKFYYVMELLTGLNLAELVRKHGPLPPERAVHFLMQSCGALHEAHGIGLIHRDLKPSNIFAAVQGGLHDVAKLLDFGLVKEHIATTEADVALTAEGKFGGSPLYMAPEQAVSFKDVDARSDIYALGGVAYFLLTGRPPFAGENFMAIVVAHAKEPPVPPSVVNEAVPADVEQIILRCLEKKPADRFPDMANLRQALAGCGCARQWTPKKAAEWWREHERAGKVEPST